MCITHAAIECGLVAAAEIYVRHSGHCAQNHSRNHLTWPEALNEASMLKVLSF